MFERIQKSRSLESLITEIRRQQQEEETFQINGNDLPTPRPVSVQDLASMANEASRVVHYYNRGYYDGGYFVGDEGKDHDDQQQQQQEEDEIFELDL